MTSAFLCYTLSVWRSAVQCSRSGEDARCLGEASELSATADERCEGKRESRF